MSSSYNVLSVSAVSEQGHRMLECTKFGVKVILNQKVITSVNFKAFASILASCFVHHQLVILI